MFYHSLVVSHHHSLFSVGSSTDDGIFSICMKLYYSHMSKRSGAHPLNCSLVHLFVWSFDQSLVYLLHNHLKRLLSALLCVTPHFNMLATSLEHAFVQVKNGETSNLQSPDTNTIIGISIKDMQNGRKCWEEWRKNSRYLLCIKYTSDTTANDKSSSYINRILTSTLNCWWWFGISVRLFDRLYRIQYWNNAPKANEMD